MAITVETLLELIGDTEQDRRAVEHQLREAESLVSTLTQRAQELREEEKSARAMLARRFPAAAGQIDAPLAELAAVPSAGPSWATMPRTDAVERAIREIHTATAATVSPGQIEDYLKRHGRNDSRDDIGGSTARLNKVGRIHSVGRGKWLPGPATTPGDGVDAPSPGSVPPERPGGDGHAAGPDLVPDHREAFGGRDTGDHDRETHNQVGGIQF